MKQLKKAIFKIRKLNNRISFLLSINWTKTLYFNFKMLSFSEAKCLPFLFYGSVSFKGLKGSVTLNTPIKFGMVGFGQDYEIIKTSSNISQLTLNGKLVVNGNIQFGKDYLVYIHKTGILEMGHLSSLGNKGKIICYKNIILGKYARIGFESQVIDTNFHRMIDTEGNSLGDLHGQIKIGDYNFIGNRVSIMKSSHTSDNCTITSNSLLNKDYRSFGTNILLGGIPAKFLKKDIKRDWESENLNSLII